MIAKNNIIEFNAASAVIDYNVTDTGISELRKEFAGLKAVDSKSYKVVTQAISKVRSLRTGVEKKRTEYKADALEYGRRIDAEAKRVTAALLEIESPLKAEKEAYDAEQERIKREAEEKERQRISGILERIKRIENAPFKHQTKTAAELQEVIQGYESSVMNDNFDYQEFTESAVTAKGVTFNYLKGMLDERQKLEAERKRLEKEKVAIEVEKAKLGIQKVAEENQRAAQSNLQPADMSFSVLESGLEALKAQENTAWELQQKIDKARQQISPKDQALVDATKFAADVHASFPIIGKPTYQELVWVITKMLPRISCLTSEEYIFSDNVRKMLTTIKEEEANDSAETGNK